VVKLSETYIHPTAVVDDGAEIGTGTTIWHFTHVSSKAVIGRDVNIGQNVYIAPGAIIGNGVKIQNNVSVYNGVVVEDFAFLGPSCVFTNVRTPRSEFPRKDHYEKTRVGRGATIGANATVVCGTTLGQYSLVAAGAVVTKDVADFAVVMGCPARPAGWACMCGVSIEFDRSGRAVCRECRRSYLLENDTVRYEKG
jgi:UDP-2-acetamido-3-amino-2,3-dideoxy-glucuronate N-acetyltransferase